MKRLILHAQTLRIYLKILKEPKLNIITQNSYEKIQNFLMKFTEIKRRLLKTEGLEDGTSLQRLRSSRKQKGWYCVQSRRDNKNKKSTLRNNPFKTLKSFYEEVMQKFAYYELKKHPNLTHLTRRSKMI